MIGKRMFITGGEGAIADGERFGANYLLPESAYLETCASIGAGFFSEQMNELHADGRYMDEFERVVYNNLLSGISLSGDQYFYENPLKATDHKRWAWHDCPCCPPMILKMAGAFPQYIYAHNNKSVYVNLFVGSRAEITLDPKNKVTISQETGYPWQGKVVVKVEPSTPLAFTLHVRIPGWAQGKENPFDLYTSTASQAVSLAVNGKAEPVKPVNGYAAITRKWKKGDVVTLQLPMQPRLVTAADSVQALKNKVAIVSGPLVFGLEGVDNPGLSEYSLTPGTPLVLTFKPDLLNGVNVVTGKVSTGTQEVTFTAIPFYAIGNRAATSPYQVWMPVKKP
jgi:DUF1680 family protein